MEEHIIECVECVVNIIHGLLGIPKKKKKIVASLCLGQYLFKLLGPMAHIHDSDKKFHLR